MALTRAFQNSIKYKQAAQPVVINGAMDVAQRSTSVTGLGDGDEGYVTVDRIRHTLDAGAGRFTSKQTAVTDLPGFANCLELDCTTADTSIAADESFHLDYRLEGADCQRFKKGYSDAEYISVGFYAKADAAVTYTAGFIDTDNSRQIRQQFTTGTDWTHHVLAFAGDTSTGDKLNDDFNESMRFRITLHGGSNFTSGTLATSWADTVEANGHVGGGSFFASTSRAFFITGLQIEIGQYTNETMPPFQFESFEESLFRCQRYYIQNDSKMPPTALSATTAWTHMMDFNPRMRAAPSTTHVATGGFSTVGGSANTTSVAVANLSTFGGRIALNLDATLTVNQWCQCPLAANCDAEL